MLNQNKSWKMPREETTPNMHRQEYNIKMNLKEIVCGQDSSGSREGPVTGFCEHGNEPLCYVKCGESLN
jgi:hypothetical protein